MKKKKATDRKHLSEMSDGKLFDEALDGEAFNEAFADGDGDGVAEETPLNDAAEDTADSRSGKQEDGEEAAFTDDEILRESGKRVAVIVGASSGIGHHTAVKLLNKGYRVYNLSRTESKDTRVFNIVTDVEKSPSVQAAFLTLFQKESKVDLFIYSAGCSMAAPVEYVKMKDVTALFNVNYFGALKTVQKVIPVMRKQGGGRIIFISSMASSLPVAFDSYYSSSKSALNMLAKGLAMELEPFNIRVSAACPGGTCTHFTYKRNAYEPAAVREYAEKMQYALDVLAKTEQNGMTPSAVADEIVALAESSNPPSSCAVGIVNKTYKIIQKLLPDRIADYFNKQQYEPKKEN